MKFIEITQYSFTSGQLTAYIPAVRPADFTDFQDYELKNSAWRDDERPVSINESYYLLTNLNKYRNCKPAKTLQIQAAELLGTPIDSEAVAPNQESWLGVSINFDTPLSGKILTQALLDWIDRHEILRSRILSANSKSVRKILPRQLVGIDKIIYGTYESAQDLSVKTKELCESNTNPYKWPSYFFFTIARETSFSLFFIADHSLIDGYSLLTAADELRLLYQPVAQKRLSRSVGSYIDHCAETIDLEISKDHPALKVWQSFLEINRGKFPIFPPYQKIETANLSDQNILQQTFNDKLLDTTAMQKLEKICKTHNGGTVFAGILAALALTNRQFENDNRFQAVLTRHTRTDSRWLKTLGWFVALCPFVLELGEEKDFLNTIELAITELNRSKVGAKLPFGTISNAFGVDEEPRFVISYMDTRLFVDPNLNTDDNAIAIRSVSYSTNDTYIWFTRTQNGLLVSSRFPGFQEIAFDMQLFFSALKELLNSVVEN